MSTAAPSHAATRASVRGAPRRSGAALGAVVFGAAAILPLLLSEGSSALDIMVLSAAYVVMALGLNVVVGFAGLLDLGYVAFFAIGAHVAAYFGSSYWANAAGGAGIALFAGEPAPVRPGSTSTSSSSSCSRSLRPREAGVLIGVPTLRLRGHLCRDRHARLRRDHRAGHVQRAGHPLLRRVAHRGTQRHHPHRQRRPALHRAPSVRYHLRPWYWFALALVGIDAPGQLPPARLAG